MATNQKSRIDIYEGILYIHLRADEAMAAGDLVALHASKDGYVAKCATTAIPFGWVAEQVTATGVADYEPGGLVSHTAKVADRVGVYICGGVYKHQAINLNFGEEVYAIAGKATATPSTSTVKVGIVLEDSDTDGLTKIKSYI